MRRDRYASLARSRIWRDGLRIAGHRAGGVESSSMLGSIVGYDSVAGHVCRERSSTDTHIAETLRDSGPTDRAGEFGRLLAVVVVGYANG
jgi:hypothetical protein